MFGIMSSKSAQRRALKNNLAAIRHFTESFRLSVFSSEFFQRTHDVEPFNYLSENHVLSIEPGRRSSRDEKLRAVRVGTRVGHGQQSRLGVFELCEKREREEVNDEREKRLGRKKKREELA